MKILVSGGAGFIGSNFVLRTLGQEWDTWVVDINKVSCERLQLLVNDNVKIFNKDMVDINFLIELKKFKPDIIMHFAATPRVAYSVEHPSSTTNNNVYKTVRMLEVAKDLGVRRFVLSSSSSIYGGEGDLPTKESQIPCPKSPYAMQKYQCEQWCQLFSQLYGLDTICLRYFNVFGPHQFAGDAYATAIASWCNNIKENKSLRLDGTGEQTRDNCFVDNTVDACVLAITSYRKFIGDVYNVGCNNRVSLNDILDYFRKRFSFNVEHAPPRVGDVKDTQADISKIERDLGYKASIDLCTGLEETFKWWKL